MFRVVISGFYGFDNAGDEAILQSMVSELRSAYSDIDIVVLSSDPVKTAQNHQVKAVNRSNLVEVLSTIKNCDTMISGGGSIFQDVTSLFSLWYYSGIIVFAFLMNKPVIAFAQGIGPVRNSFNKRLLKYIMNRVISLSVRDKRSQNQLKEMGVKKDILCFVDPAFLIAADSSSNCKEILLNEGGAVHKPGRIKIGFSVRNWKSDVNASSVFAEVADRAVRELNAEVFFFPLHYSKDIGLAEEITRKMKEKAVVVRGSYSPMELIGLYGLMDVNVSVRFHGLVFSIMNHVPMVAISYDPKIDSLMDALDMPDILYYDTMNADTIYKALKEKLQHRSELSRKIGLKVKEFNSLARRGTNELISSLEYIRKTMKNT